MIKKITAIVVFLLAISTLQAQTKSAIDSWSEIKAFHKVMSQTFHPSEEGNLQPIKSRSGEMLEAAKKLSTTIPTELNNKLMKKTIKNLVKKTNKVNKLVKSNASDADLTQALADTHDVFHQIVGMCSNEEHH